MKNSLVNTCLKVLDISNNPLKNEGVEELLNILKQKYKTKIINLNLTSCGLTHKILGKLFPVLTKNHHLRELLLDQNNFEKDKFIAIKEGLRMNKTLIILSLSMCKIDDKGARTIGECLTTSVNLHKIILSNN